MSILSKIFKRKPVDEQEKAREYFDFLKYKTGSFLALPLYEESSASLWQDADSFMENLELLMRTYPFDALDRIISDFNYDFTITPKKLVAHSGSNVPIELTIAARDDGRAFVMARMSKWDTNERVIRKVAWDLGDKPPISYLLERLFERSQEEDDPLSPKYKKF